MSHRDIPLSHADAAWLHMETPTNLMMINGLFYLAQAPPRERLLQVIGERLLAWERFRMKAVEPKLGLGRPHWELDQSFNLSDHVIWEELAQPNHSALMQRAGDLMGVPLDRSRPLWEFRVFPQVDRGAVIMVRLHHAIADGMALMRVLLNLADDEHGNHASPSQKTRERVPADAFTRAKKAASHFLHESHDLLFYPEKARKFAREGMAAGRSLARLATLKADHPSAFKGELGQKKLTAVSPALELPKVKAIGVRFGCTINDVLMATLAGALGSYLRKSDALPPDLNLRAVVPVDLRGGDVEGLGNRFGMVFLELPVGQPDPLKRLRIVHQRMEALKGSVEAMVVYEILSAVGTLPGELEKKVVKLFGDKATAVVTNLPGPRQQLYLAGSKIDSMMYWVPQSGGLGLGVSLMSYNGTVRIGVACDAALTPAPDQITEMFQQTLQEFEDYQEQEKI